MTLHTEEEAKELWCPFARVVEFTEDTISAPYNRAWAGDGHPTRTHEPLQCRCIGDRCMAWRWEEHDLGPGKPRAVGPKGCCGLAGNPNPLVYMPPIGEP